MLVHAVFFNLILLYFFFCYDVNAILSLEYVHEEQIREEMVYFFIDHELIVFEFWMSLRKTLIIHN